MRVPFFRSEAPDTFPALVNEYIEWLRVRAYSEGAIESRTKLLGYFMIWGSERGLLKPSEVTPPILERYQRHLFYQRKRDGKALSFSSQSSRISILRSFFKWLARKRYIPYNPASEMELPKKGKTLPKAILSEREIELILSLPDVTTPLGLRDRAILELFYSTGIRRMEMANLKVHDLDLETPTLMIRNGKGRKDRLLPLGKRAALWVEKYLYDARPLLVTGLEEGALFLNHKGEPFRRNGLTRLAANTIQSAKLGKKGGCHLFRHAMATHMLENGADIRFVQEMLGHSNIETTQIYTHVSIRKLREVHSLTHPSEKTLREVEREEKPQAQEFSIQAITETYLQEKATMGTSRTTGKSKSSLSHLLKWYGNRPIEALTPDLVNEYKLRRSEIGEESLHTEIKEFDALLRFARDRSLSTNPAIFTSKNSFGRYLPQTEFEQVLSHLTNPYLRLCLRFLREMGLRIGETALKQHQIDPDRQILRVLGSRPRNLRIPHSILAEYLSLPKISEWVCPSKNPKKPIPLLMKSLIKACKHSGVEPFQFNDLRKSFHIDLAEKGVPGSLRNAILGLSQTMAEGKEEREKAMNEAMEALEEQRGIILKTE